MPTSQPNFVSEFGQTAIDQLANQESSLQPNQSNCSVNGGGEGIGTFHYEQSQYNDRQTQNNNKHYVFIDQHQRQFQNGQQQQSQVSSVSVNHGVQNQIQNPGQQQNPGPLQNQGHFQNQIARQTYHPSSAGDYYDYPQMMDTNVQSTIENVPQFPYHNQHLTNMLSSILPDSISNGFSNNFTAQHPKKSTYEWYNIQNDHVSSSPGIPAAPSSANMASSSSSSGQGGHSRTSSTNTAGSEMQDLLKPKVATTFWEDENTVCYQVFARKVLVSRREDTDFINGTKLLNVIGMSRGKRDGMLKSEKTRSVVKVGLMNLKGVWIPFERAYEIARNEGIDVLLHPLFVKNLKDFYRTEGYKLRSDDAGVLTSPVEDVSSQEDASKMQSSSSISELLNAPVGGIASVIGGSVLYGHSSYSPSSHAPTFKPDLTKEGALSGTNLLAASELISIRETSGALDAEQLVQHTEFELSLLNQAKQQKFTYYTHQAAVAESSRIP